MARLSSLRSLYFDLQYRFGRPDWLTHAVQPALEDAVWEGQVRGPAVLDLGCGAGDNSLYLARRGFAVTAVDIAPTAIAMARAKAQAEGLAVRFLVLDAAEIGDLGQRFDTILDFGLLPHLGGARRRRYLAGLQAVSHGGTRLLLQCRSERGARPRVLVGTPRLSQDQLHEAFDGAWRIDWVRAAALAGRGLAEAPGWLAALRPLPWARAQ